MSEAAETPPSAIPDKIVHEIRDRAPNFASEAILLFLDRDTGTPLAVTDTHLHLLRVGNRPEESRPDTREPRILWSMDRRHTAWIDAQHGSARALLFPITIKFDDGRAGLERHPWIEAREARRRGGWAACPARHLLCTMCALPSLTGGERCCLIMIARARPPVRPDHVRSVCGPPICGASADRRWGSLRYADSRR